MRICSQAREASGKRPLRGSWRRPSIVNKGRLATPCNAVRIARKSHRERRWMYGDRRGVQYQRRRCAGDSRERQVHAVSWYSIGSTSSTKCTCSRTRRSTRCLKHWKNRRLMCVFIFATTEIHKIPATILSRCQHLQLSSYRQNRNRRGGFGMSRSKTG